MSETIIPRPEVFQELECATRDHAIVLLKGPWGSGKSTLLEQYAARARERDPHLDVLEVALTGSVAVDAFCHAMGRAMALTTRHESSAIAEALSARTGSLVMLDDCSGASAECRALLSAWSRAAPGVTFVCGSQRRLGIDERTVELTGLATTPPEAGGRSPAAELLVEFVRAAMVHGAMVAPPRFDDDELNMLAQAADGNPLTLRFCAALLAFLTPTAVRDALVQPSTRLSALSPEAPPLIAAFCDLQWNQLSRAQQLLLLDQ